MANPIPPGASALALFGGQAALALSWETRLQEAAYTPPSGSRIRFDYEDVGLEVTKRTAAFEFPGVNEAYVQDNGHGSRRYPMRCFFWGNNHDRIANAFIAALLEPGAGRLEHPLYGTFNVIPFGDITRRDDLKNAANQTIVEVTFWTTLLTVYPSSQINNRSEILAALDGFDVAAAQQFANSTDLVGALNQATAKATIRSFLRDISAALQSVADVVTSVNTEFRKLESTINLGLDVFIGQPLLLAQQISNLIKAPARALAGIESRLDAYGRLADRIFGSSAGNPRATLTTGTALPLRTTRVANDFHISDLCAMNALAGSVLSVVENTFATKPSALLAAEAVLEQFDLGVAWRDDAFDALADIPKIGTFQVDTGGSYQALQQAVALAVGHLINVSFTLVPERRVVLDRPRTIVDLAAELYGSVDDRLDFLISTNNLTGSEILELQPGRSIVYYPDP